MTKIIRSLIVVIVLIFIGKIEMFAQQLPQFNQYVFNGIHINPGYAGYKNEGYVQSTYRAQWLNFPGAPRTTSVTADFSANEGRMGFGVSVLSDRVGPTENKIGLLTYAYRVQLGEKSFLATGVSGGFSDYMLDPNLLSANDIDDPLIPNTAVRKVAPNFNAGVFFNTDKMYLGFSTYNLIGRGALKRENVALMYQNLHFYLTGGALIPLGKDFHLKPSALIKHTKGSPTSYDLNAMISIQDKIWIGGGYRSNFRLFKDDLQDRSELNNRTALVGLMEIFATKNLRLGYAYDHNMNILRSSRSNSHEFSLGYYLKKKKTIMKNPRTF